MIFNEDLSYMEPKSINLDFHSREDVAKNVKKQEKLETAQFGSNT